MGKNWDQVLAIPPWTLCCIRLSLCRIPNYTFPDTALKTAVQNSHPGSPENLSSQSRRQVVAPSTLPPPYGVDGNIQTLHKPANHLPLQPPGGRTIHSPSSLRSRRQHTNPPQTCKPSTITRRKEVAPSTLPPPDGVDSNTMALHEPANALPLQAAEWSHRLPSLFLTESTATHKPSTNPQTLYHYKPPGGRTIYPPSSLQSRRQPTNPAQTREPSTTERHQEVALSTFPRPCGIDDKHYSFVLPRPQKRKRLSPIHEKSERTWSPEQSFFICVPFSCLIYFLTLLVPQPWLGTLPSSPAAKCGATET